MENSITLNPVQEELAEIPPLIKYISSNEDFRFDDIKESSFSLDHCQLNASQSLTPVAEGIESNFGGGQDEGEHSVSISMPVTPAATAHLNSTRRVFFSGETIIDDVKQNESTAAPNIASSGFPKYYSQPMPKGSISLHTRNDANLAYHQCIKGLKDKRFDSFKTWSGKLERQLTNLRGRSIRETESENDSSMKAEVDKNLPVHRYFDALEGPELDRLRDLEETLLPQDKTWPFLLRFPVSAFGICLGISSQAILWKTLAASPSTKFLHIPSAINLVLWFISIAVIAVIFSIYLLKVILYFEAVRREYYHPIRINFFFAPWIALLFLALGVPPEVANNLPQALWYILMTPILCLELKLYGQWMSGGQRRLSKVANPSNHLSIVGNFVGALLGASIGLKEGPIFFFAVGLAHYTVLFVTLYQRLPTNDTLPKDLHPVFFLFVAAPSVASMAWAKIQGSFDYGSRIAYFIALFLYCSLAVRINFFRGIKFSLAWWAYTFPMTGAAIATIRYSNEVTNIMTKSLCIILSSVSTLTVTALLITTILHAFVLRDLFPNDLAIAISDKRRKAHRKWFHLRDGSADSNIENFLKCAASIRHNDLEASVEDGTSDETEATTPRRVSTNGGKGAS